MVIFLKETHQGLFQFNSGRNVAGRMRDHDSADCLHDECEFPSVLTNTLSIFSLPSGLFSENGKQN